MRRMVKIGALVALASLSGVPAAGAQSLTWGVFRENANSIAESQRNCWSQAMVSGQTINGELMAQNLTEARAQLKLQELGKRGLCASQRTAASWSARGKAETNDSSFDGANAGSFGSGWSNAGQFDSGNPNQFNRGR